MGRFTSKVVHVDAISNEITLVVKQGIAGGLERARNAAAQIAAKEKQKVITLSTIKDGVEPANKSWVDNSEGLPFNSVKRNILIQFDYKRRVVKETLLELKKAAPKESGRFVKSYIVYVAENGDIENNGKAIADLREIPFNGAVAIVNAAPYARRIEVGKTKTGRKFVLRAEYQHIEGVAKSVIVRRFERIANVSFNYLHITNAYELKGFLTGTRYIDKNNHSRKRTERKDWKKGEMIQYPSVIIRGKW